MPVKAIHSVQPTILCTHDAEEVAEHEGHLQIVCKHCLAELRVEKHCPDCDAPVISKVIDED